jgi:hypothetical protein
MIKVSDHYNLLPGIWEYPEFIRAPSLIDADVAVLSFFSNEAHQTTNQLTVFVTTEPDIHSAHEQYSLQLRCRPNHIIAVSCKSPTLQYQLSPTVEYWSNLVFTTVNNPLCATVELGPKLYLASALLGGWMYSRGVMLKSIVDLGLDNQCLINYQKRVVMDNQLQDICQHPQYFQNYRSPALNELDDKNFVDKCLTNNGLFTMYPNEHGVNQMSWMSQQISYNVYNSCYLDIVAETENCAHNDTFFPSEKIAKPLLLGQPFVVYGCQGFLKRLQEIGFKTFGEWIDESYDQHSDRIVRAKAVVNSVYEFSKLTTDKKIHTITEMQPALEHNRRIMLDLAKFTKGIVDSICLNFK